VAVLPIAVNNAVVNEKDIELRFTKGSGPGGQRKNKVETCVIAKHLPTGMEIRCDTERSQHQNRALALELLYSKVLDYQTKKSTNERARDRKEQIGSGMRGDKVRTIRCQDNIVKCEITGQKVSLARYLGGEIGFSRRGLM
jgi:peptide chain release factor 1